MRHSASDLLTLNDSLILGVVEKRENGKMAAVTTAVGLRRVRAVGRVRGRVQGIERKMEGGMRGGIKD